MVSVTPWDSLRGKGDPLGKNNFNGGRRDVFTKTGEDAVRERLIEGVFEGMPEGELRVEDGGLQETVDRYMRVSKWFRVAFVEAWQNEIK